MTNRMKMAAALIAAMSDTAAQAAPPEWLQEFPVQVTCHGHHPRVAVEGALAVGVDLKAGKLRYAYESGAGEPVAGGIGPVAGINSTADVGITAQGFRSLFREPASLVIRGHKEQVFRVTRTEAFELTLDPAEEGESYVVGAFSYGHGLTSVPGERPVTKITPPIAGWACEVQGL